jgi:hypothetical protein
MNVQITKIANGFIVAIQQGEGQCAIYVDKLPKEVLVWLASITKPSDDNKISPITN